MVQAKTSPADLASRRPIARKAAAKGTQAQKGAHGSAFAAALIADATEEAKQIEKQRESYKDRLRKLAAFSREDHLEFRAALGEARATINATAKVKNMTVIAYLPTNTVDQTIYQMVSVWTGLSAAVETGYRPDYDQSWSSIQAAATKHKNATGSGGHKVNGGPTMKKGRKSQGPIGAAVKMAKNTMLTPQATALPKEERKLADTVAAFVDASKPTLEEMREIAARIQIMLEAAEKTAEAVGKAQKESKGTKAKGEKRAAKASA